MPDLVTGLAERLGHPRNVRSDHVGDWLKQVAVAGGHTDQQGMTIRHWLPTKEEGSHILA
ncbi:hypothetical protein GCM10027290_48460 [Micromonospora sonneratiae]